MDFVNLQLFPKLKSLTITGQADRAKVVHDFFEDAYNYMKSGTLLRQVINKINEDIDFNKADDRHTLEDVYEQLLRDLQSAGNAGEYYNPPRRHSVHGRYGQSPARRNRPRSRVRQPAASLSAPLNIFRKQDVKTAKQEADLQRSVHGVEKKPLPHMLCVTT